VATTLGTRPNGKAAGNGTAPPGMRLVPPRQRKASWVALGVLLIAVAALAFGTWSAQLGHRVSVLVAARDIPAGSTVSRADLATARIAVDGRVRYIASSNAKGALGQVAAVTIPKGALLHPDEMADGPTLPAGEAVVGAALAPGAVPATLHVGDRVHVVATSTPNHTSDERTGVLATAVVYALRDLDDAARTTVVSLRVPASAAAVVADAAGAGRVRLVLLGGAS